MEIRLKKRPFVRLVSFSAAGFLVLGGLFYQSFRERRQLVQYLEQNHARALAEVSSGLTSMCASLEQMRYVENGPQLWALSAQLLRESAVTKQALLSLPLLEGQLAGAGRFLSQTGSFSMAMSRAAADSEGLQQAHRQSLTDLLAYGEGLRDSVAEAAAADAPAELTERAVGLMDKPAALLGVETDDAPHPQGLYAAFTAYDEDTTDYPSLVYDGPFSDHLSDRQPTMTAAANAITEEQAAELASRITHTSADDLQTEGVTRSNLPAYVFRTADFAVEISVKGGHLTQLRYFRQVQQEKLEPQTAKLRAEQFLESLSLSGLQIVYTQQINGLRMFHYVPLTAEGVLCYPDVVKIGVAADNGAVLFFDSRNYLMNHTDRNMPSEYISEDKILENLSPHLQIQSQHLAWIPTDGAGERFCWEIRCTDKSDGQQVWVYRNALTGYEEDVQLIETE